MDLTTAMSCHLLLPLLLLLLPLLSSLVLLLRSRKQQNKPSTAKLPPGPPRLPIIGNLYQLGDSPHRSLLQLSREHGPLMSLQLGTVAAVVASSAATAREFLKVHDLECCSRPLLYSWRRLSYGYCDIALSPYSDLWRVLRKNSIIEFFSSKKVALFRSIREEEVELMVSQISSRSKESAPINLSAVLLSLASDITCRAALGKKYPTGEGSQLYATLMETQAMLGGFFYADYLPVFGWLDVLSGMRARLEKNFRDLDSFYEQVISEHPSRQWRLKDREDTIDALLRLQKDEANLTGDQIKAVLMNIFIGGSDTSSSAVEWAMAELMRNQQAMKKVQEEVRRVLGTKGKVEETDLDKLHYFKCVVKEVMRMHPPAPLLVHRETMQPCKVQGFDIPAKAMLIINALAIGREADSWENPEQFCPERFMDSSIDLKGHDFQLIPFGAGRRICPGMHVGLAVLELILANLLYCFDWELPVGMTEEDIDMDEATGITVHRKSALHLVATKYCGIAS